LDHARVKIRLFYGGLLFLMAASVSVVGPLALVLSLCVCGSSVRFGLFFVFVFA
jgi:hypothetical protein